MNKEIKNTLVIGVLTIVATTPLVVTAQPSQLFNSNNDKYLSLVKSKSTKHTQENPLKTETEFKGVHLIDEKYHLVNEVTQTYNDVVFDTGITGDKFIETIKVNKENSGEFYFDMSLNGPTDSVVTITVNGVTHLTRSVEMGVDTAPVRLVLPKGNNEIKVEYQVGSLEVVNANESFLELGNLRYVEHQELDTVIEYQLGDSAEWITYKGGIEFKWHQHKPTEIKVRYNDEQGQQQVYTSTVDAPMPVAPIVSVSKAGKLEINMFNYANNFYEKVLVRFNDGDWVSYEEPIDAEFIGDKTKVEVKVTNQYGKTLQLAAQTFSRPTMGVIKADRVDNFIVLNYEGSQIGNPYLEYKMNDGKWTTYEKPFELDYKDGVAVVKTRVKNDYGQVVEGETQRLDAPKTELPEIEYSDRLVKIQGGVSQIKHIIEQASFDSVPSWLSFDREVRVESKDKDSSLSNLGLDWMITGGELVSPIINNDQEYELSWTVNAKAGQTFGLTFKQLASFGLTDGTVKILVNNQPIEQTKVTTNWQRIENIPLNEGENKITISYQNASALTAPTQLMFDEFSLSEVKETETNQTYYRINQEGDWTLYEGSVKILYRDWKESGVLIESVSINEFGATSEVKELRLDKSQQPQVVAPSITSVSLNSTNPKTHDNIVFSIDADFEDESVEFEEYAITGDYKTSYTEAGEKTVYIKVKDNRGVWSEAYEYKFTVSEAVAPVISGLRVDNTKPLTGQKINFKYDIKLDDGASIAKVEWGGDYATSYNKPGERTVTLRVQDSRGLWSETQSVTFYVYEANPIKPTLVFPNETLVIKKGETPNFLEGVRLNNGTATNVSYKLLSNGFDSNKVGLQTVKYEITYTQDNQEYKTIVERQVKVTAPAVNPVFKFPTLSVTQGQTPNFKDATINNGTATDVKYSLIESTFDKNKVGKQTVRYYVTFNQYGEQKSMYVERVIEVKAKIVHPTLKFPALSVTQGKTPNFKDAKITAGSAKNVRYSLIESTFNKNKVGKQTVRYYVKYEINGKTYDKYVDRVVEVKAKITHPTLKFPALSVTQGKTPNFKDAKITAGSAKNVRYSLIESTFNKNKVGKQTVRYYVKYEIDGKTYDKYVDRVVEVKAKITHPTLKFSKLVVKKGQTPNFKDAKITAGSAKNVRYSLIESTFNKNKVGKQTVRYYVKYEINGKTYDKYVERVVEVKK